MIVRKAAKHKVASIDKQIEQLADRIVEASIPAVIGKYEQLVAQLEKDKLLMEETLHIQGIPKGRFE